MGLNFGRQKSSVSTSEQYDNRIAADGGATVIRVEDGSTVHLQQGILPDTETGGWSAPEGGIADLLRFTQEQGIAARNAVAGDGVNQTYLILGAVLLIGAAVYFKR